MAESKVLELLMTWTKGLWFLMIETKFQML